MTGRAWPLPVRVAWLGAIGMVVALLRVATDTVELLPVDRWGARVLASLGPPRLAHVTVRLGDPLAFAGVTAVAVSLVWARRGLAIALAVLAATGLAGSAAELLKYVVGPVRLYYVAFPSAHVAATAALAAGCALALWPAAAPWGRGALAAGAAVVILLMGWAVIATHRHTVTEALGGLGVAVVALGAVFDLGLAWLGRRPARR
jgi:membrane-associated phospholipid phosphatase